MSTDGPSDFSSLTSLYLFLLISGGQILLPILICIFLFAKSVTRHPTLTNFLFSWVIYSVAYTLLKYGNTKDTRSAVCLVQNIAIHGAPPMAGMAGLIAIIYIWAAFVSPQRFADILARPVIRNLALLLPYVTLFLYCMATAIVTAQMPETVTMRNGLYCTLAYPPFNRVVPGTCIIFLCVVLGFEVSIGIQYYRLRNQIASVFPLADRPKTSTSLVLRISLFNLFLIVILSSASFMVSGLQGGTWSYVISSSVPLAAAIVFGTQKDLYMWLRGIWRTHSEETTLRDSVRTSTHGDIDNLELPATPRQALLKTDRPQTSDTIV